MKIEPWQMEAVQLGQKIAAGEFSALEVMESYLARIAAVILQLMPLRKLWRPPLGKRRARWIAG